LARMRELAVQASNDTLSASDRANLDAEFTQLSAEIDRISSTVAFNGIYLLNSGMSTGLTLQIGANNGDTFTLTIQGAQYSTLYANNTVLTVTTIGFQSAASAVISAIDTTVNAVSTRRANLGALQSRLESVGRSIAVASENTAAANSRVADADIASSMSELVRAQILQQAVISVLAQANQAPALVLQLLK